MLEIRDLTVEIPTLEGMVRPLNGVNLRIGAGQILGLAGESGAGKSMTGLAILRMLPPRARVVRGDILVDGRDVLKMRDSDLPRYRGREVSVVFQDPMTFLNPVYSVGEQLVDVILSRKPRDGGSGRLDRRRAKEMALDLFRRVHIPKPEERIDDYPHQFSGGMRQRVLIAMAIAGRPKLLVADEPSTALDATVQVQILKLIRELARESALAVLLVSHDLRSLAMICDRVGIMYAGLVVEAGPTSAVVSQPSHPYTAGLLDSVPRGRKTERRLRPIGGQPPNPLDLPSGCPFHPRCGRAMEVCRRVTPAEQSVGEANVRCHLYQ